MAAARHNAVGPAAGLFAHADLTHPNEVAKYAADAANRAGNNIYAAPPPAPSDDLQGRLQEDRELPQNQGSWAAFKASGGSKVGPEPSSGLPSSSYARLEPMRVDVQGDSAPKGLAAVEQTAPGGLAVAGGNLRGGSGPMQAPPWQAAAGGPAPPRAPPPQSPPPPGPVPPQESSTSPWPHEGSAAQPPYPFPPNSAGMMLPPNGLPPGYQMPPPLMWPHAPQYMPGGYPMSPYMDPQAMAKGGMMFPPMMHPGMYPMGMPPDGSGAHRGDKNVARAKSAGGAKKARSKERRKRGRAKGRDKSPPPQDADDTANVSPALKKVILEAAKCKMPMEEVRGHIIEFATHQHGSKFLQAKLDDANTTEEDKTLILEEALPEAANLAKQTYGNHFIQKLFEKVSMDQRKELANRLQGHILSLTMDSSGCRVIQKALHVVSRSSQMMLANELKKSVHDCIIHMHGNHVIQKCIEQMPPDSVNFIIQAVEEKVCETASHMYGCRVIQRLLEHCQSQQLSKIQQEIVAHAQRLSSDAYGNYVVQHVLEHGRKDDKREIIVQVTKNLLEFSRNKHSSNVVEKCFEFATCGEHSALLAEERANLMMAVLGTPGDPSAPICQMMNDKFGNYIVQRVIEYCKGGEKEILRLQLISQEANLRNNANGKHILSAAQKEYGENLFVANNGVPP